MDKPTAQQVKEYANGIDYDIDAEDFLNHYNVIGWVYGKNRTPVASWEACVRTWKKRAAKRQRDAQSEASGKVRHQYYEPTVFVQCVKGRTVGRFLPVVFGGPREEDIPREQYVSAAKRMIEELVMYESGNEWVIRENATHAELAKERLAAIKAKINAAPKPKRRTPLQIKQELKQQVKAVVKAVTKKAKELEDDLKF